MRSQSPIQLFLVSLAAATTGCSGRGAVLVRSDAAPPELVHAMLEAASVGSRDVVYDLENGETGIAVEAASRGASVVRLAGVHAKDALESDISPATVVVLSNQPQSDAGLEERLRTRLRPGTRIVSCTSALEGWQPDKTIAVTAAGREHKVRLWIVRGAEMAPNLGPFVPTPLAIVEKMLEMAEVTPADVVYDLGCGDGRIVIEAAKRFGARGVGIDYDLRLCKEAREGAELAGVADRVEIRHEDVTQSDFSDATVVALYLLPKSNELLRPKLEALKPGTRLVAHDFKIGDWKPLREEVLWIRGDTERHTVYLWRVGE